MTVSLQFSLEIEEEWPPVASESLPFEKSADGFEAQVPPLFVRDLAVGDIIQVIEKDSEGIIISWKHVRRSEHSTVWLLRMGEPNNIRSCLEEARSIGCNTSTMDEFGCYSIDVPPSVAMPEIDGILAALDEASVAVAYPAMRHCD